MTDTAGLEFVAKHTHNVTAINNSEGKLGLMDGTTLNTAIQKACGDHKGKFSMAIMHSAVATNLENLKLLVYLKYNDANGMQRDLSIGTLNGRLVMVDDSMPTEDIYTKTADTAIDSAKTYYTQSGDDYTAVAKPTVGSIGNYYELTGTSYITYVFGDGAIEYTNCGAKVPYEMYRDPKTNGGADTLYSRQRKCFSPYGISFTQKTMKTLSPSDDELELGENWELVNSNEDGEKKYIAHKAIPIARIISLG
jgi:hypothetical protein